ncbi:MAG: type II toxin-antitoxin system PemK/MazF family toxin [Chitinophagaceae bacterium]|jgi:mRNA interferase MazF|nr:type II toxin-antitoxin system PemK/MazF family toxin [Chitinophagaceae bacterium]
MREGEIILAHLPQSDGNIKLRPVSLLKQLPGYNDFLVCDISTQLHQFIKDFDELIDEKNNYFVQTGLSKSSIIRLSFLAIIPQNKIAGSIGKTETKLHKNLLERLAKYLMR